MKKELIFSFSLIGKVGIATALPVVVFGLLGRYLDRRFMTSPKIFIALIIFSLLISILMLMQIVKEALKVVNKK